MRHSLGWDWGAGEARWVELTDDHGRPKVRAFGATEMPAAGSGVPIEPLRAVVAQHRWRGHEVVTALPRTAVTLTWLSMPAASRDDMAGMVELEAAQTLPFPVDEASWDFAAGPEAADGNQPVLLVAARRAIAEERRRQIESAGLRVGALTVDVLAMTALARASSAESEHTGVLVLLDANTVTLSYLDAGRVLMSRTAALAVAPLPQERDVSALALEVRRTLVAGAAAARSGSAEAAESWVWLAGQGADAELASALAVALPNRGETIIRIALLSRDAIEGADAMPRALDLALGLALLGMRAPAGGALEAVNLARRAYQATEAAEARPHRRVPWLVGAGVAALAIAYLLLAGPSAKDRGLARAAAQAQTEAKQFATRRTEVEGHVRALTGAIVPVHSYLDVLNEISAIAGSQIWLTQFTYDRGHPIVIRGSAKTNTAVTRLVEGLRSSPHLETVTLGAMTESETNKLSLVQFIIQGTLKGDSALEAPRRRSSTRQTQTKKEPT